MVMLTLADFVLDKFGGDSLAETRDNLERYRERISRPPEAPVAGGARTGRGDGPEGVDAAGAPTDGEAGSGGDD
jgi:hypothetical protein